MLTPPSPSFLLVSEVGRQVRKSPQAVVRLIHSGHLPAVKIGRTYRVPAAALQEFLDRAQVQARGDSPRFRETVAVQRHREAERRCQKAGI